MRKSTLVLGLIVALFVPVTGLAQGTSGNILGTVADESGGVLPGVEVTVTNVDTGTTRLAISDDEGRYRVPEVVPGNYEISAALTGFTTAVRSGISMTVNRQARVDLTLSVGEITERVVVTGEAPAVDTTSSTIVGLVDERKIRDLPLNGRSFSDLITLQMGTFELPTGASNSASGFGTKISISGARPSSNSFLLDGNFVNGTLGNTPGGATGLFLGVETLREFSVLTNTYGAEYGQSMGGIINAVTKSGTNQYHGSVFYFHRNDNLDARNFFDRDPSISTRSDPPEFRRHQFGFTAGGPIVEDKTFIFGGFEGLRELLATSIVFGTYTDEAKLGIFPIDDPVTDPGNLCARIDRQLATTPFSATYLPATNRCQIPLGGPAIPGGPDIADYIALFLPPANQGIRDAQNGVGEGVLAHPRVSEQDNFVIKLDHNLSDSDSFFGRYTFDDATVDRPLINFTTLFITRNQYVTLEEKHIFSPTLLNVARVGFNRSSLQESDFGINGPIPENMQLVPTDKSALPQFQSGLLGTWNPPLTGAGFSAPMGGSSVTPRIYRTNLFEYSDTLSWTRGSHSIKFGANLKRVQANMISPQRTFGSHQFGSNVFHFLTGAQVGALSFITADSNVQRGIRFWAMGFFAQDDFQVRPNLTLNIGLRYEPSTDHTEVNNKIGTLLNIRTDPASVTVNSTYRNPTKNNWAPRIGFAWDPTGNGKTSVRAGFGMFYNIQMTELDRISATSNPPFTTIATVSPLPFPFDFNACCAQSSAASRTALELIDFEAPQSYRIQWNLNVQHEIVQDTTLTVGYVGARGVDLFKVYQWNEPDPVDPSECQPDDGPTCVNPDPGRSPYYWPAFGDRPDSTFLFGGFIPGGRTCPKGGPGFFRCPRLNPNFDSVIQRSGGADSYYHGLQLQVNKRFSRGFQVQASYAWSHSIDNSSKQIRGPGESNQTSSTRNWRDMDSERGNSNFDVQHNFTLNYTIDLPGQNMAGAAGQVLGGWQLGGIVTMATGVPETIVLGFDNCRCLNGEIYGVGGTDNRPDLVGNGNPIVGDGRDPNNYFDTSSTNFVPSPAGFHGTLGRNTLRIPGLATFDFSLVKNTALAEEVNLEFRFEAFNIFNRANFADPSTSLFTGGRAPNRSAGRITRTHTTARQLQLALKINF